MPVIQTIFTHSASSSYWVYYTGYYTGYKVVQFHQGPEHAGTVPWCAQSPTGRGRRPVKSEIIESPQLTVKASGTIIPIKYMRLDEFQFAFSLVQKLNQRNSNIFHQLTYHRLKIRNHFEIISKLQFIQMLNSITTNLIFSTLTFGPVPLQ